MSGKSSQIFGVILFIALGVSAIFLGIKQYSEKINRPFAVNADAYAAAKNKLAAEGALLPQDDPNSKVDTDGDGLTDYEEVHLYHTSPYIKDTDSDGLSDAEEINKGTDPNCPQGKTCAPTLPTNTQIPSLDANEPALDMSMNLNDVINQALNAPEATDTNAPLAEGSAPSAAEIRTMLINAGLDERSLSGLSDADLVALYQESLAETSGQAAKTNTNAR